MAKKSLSTLTIEDSGVHTLKGIMGNQGKIAKELGHKIHAFLDISIPSFIFEKKFLL